MTKLAPAGGLGRAVGSSALAKIAVMAASGGLAIITTRLIIENFGVGAYAQYGLLTSMAALVPFADLGMSAAIINVVAGSAAASTDSTVRRTLISAFRVLFGSAAVLATVGVLLTAFGLWPTVLGKGLQAGGSTAALLCVLVFSVTLPLGVGQRILTGLGKNHVQIGTQALAAPFILGTLAVLLATQMPAGNFVSVLSYLASTVVAAVSLWLAGKAISPQVGSALRAAPKLITEPGVKIMDVAWPMLAQMIALPIAMQTDRLLLSHLAGDVELAQYNLGAQLFGMITQTMAAAGMALWPIFARSRANSEIRAPWRLSGIFLLAALVLGGSLAAVMPWVGPVITGGRITLSGWLILGFVLFVAVQAAKYPTGMYMTDLKGLKFQVIPLIVMVPLNLGLSWILIAPIGAAGPVFGSVIAVTLCQLLPNFWYVRRDLRVRRQQAAVVVG